MSDSRRYRLAILAALVFAGCGSAGVAVKAMRSEHVLLADSSAESDGKLTIPEPVLTADVINGFDFLYRFITETEFVLCLEGTVHKGQLHIEAFRLARIDATTANHVRYQPCTSERYIGTAHNHPPRYDHCSLSEPDRRSFANDTRAVIEVVLCGNSKYVWVLKDGRNGIGALPSQDNPTAKTVAARQLVTQPPRD